MEENIGKWMYDLADRMFPICRSLTGDGVRETLSILREQVPEMTLHEVPSGTQVFDWTVPKEWIIRDAYIEDAQGTKIIDFQKNNLHVMGYSIPVDEYVELEELLKYVYVQEDQPEAIPYVTSYYKERFGFCMSKNQRDSLKQGKYHMVIDSELIQGSLTYGEILLPGKSEKEILLSTYVCHPSMANNELSGPCVAVALAKMIKERQNRNYSYRILFIPETLGSITYLSTHLKELKKNVIAGYVLSCVGDNRAYSYVPSRKGDTLADRAAKNVLNFTDPNYARYTFLQRGSDERQYNAPGVDLPVCVVCRTKYGMYPEYHTSLDDMNLISPEGLYGAYHVYEQIIQAIEENGNYQVTCFCEPQLGKRGLYPTISKKGSYDQIKSTVDLIAYADGTNDLITISDLIQVPVSELIPIVQKMLEQGLFTRRENS